MSKLYGERDHYGRYVGPTGASAFRTRQTVVCAFGSHSVNIGAGGTPPRGVFWQAELRLLCAAIAVPIGSVSGVLQRVPNNVDGDYSCYKGDHAIRFISGGGDRDTGSQHSELCPNAVDRSDYRQLMWAALFVSGGYTIRE